MNIIADPFRERPFIQPFLGKTVKWQIKKGLIIQTSLEAAEWEKRGEEEGKEEGEEEGDEEGKEEDEEGGRGRRRGRQ